MQGTFPSEQLTMLCGECGGIVVEEIGLHYVASAPRKFCLKCQKYVNTVNYVNSKQVNQEPK